MEFESNAVEGDMVGVNEEIDYYATTALWRGECFVGRAAEEHPQMAEKITEAQRGRLEAIQEGSLRTAHRLVHTPLAESDKCYRCGHVRISVGI